MAPRTDPRCGGLTRSDVCDEQFRGSHRPGQLSTRSPTGRRDERRSSVLSQARPSFERHVHATDHIQARRPPALARRETPTLAGDAAKTPVAPVAAERPRTPPPRRRPETTSFSSKRPSAGQISDAVSSAVQATRRPRARASGRSWARHREKLLIPVRCCSLRGSAASLPTAVVEHNEQYASIPLRADRTRLTIQCGIRGESEKRNEARTRPACNAGAGSGAVL